MDGQVCHVAVRICEQLVHWKRGCAWSTAACFIGNDVIETIEIDDDGEEYTCGSDYSDSDSDLDEPFISEAEDLSLCGEATFEDAPYTNRKRRLNV